MKEERRKEIAEKILPTARAPRLAGGAVTRFPALGDMYWRSPFETLHELDHYFDDMRRNMESLIRMPSSLLAAGTPAHLVEPVFARADLEDAGPNYVVCAELPGFEKDQVTVEVFKHGIEIEGKRELKDETKRRGYLAREREYSSVRRTFEFPEEVKPEEVSAELMHGLLTVTVPKANPAPVERRTKVAVK